MFRLIPNTSCLSFVLVCNRSKESEQTRDVSRNRYELKTTITSWTWNKFIQIKFYWRPMDLLKVNFTFYFPTRYRKYLTTAQDARTNVEIMNEPAPAVVVRAVVVVALALGVVESVLPPGVVVSSSASQVPIS